MDFADYNFLLLGVVFLDFADVLGAVFDLLADCFEIELGFLESRVPFGFNVAFLSEPLVALALFAFTFVADF